MLDLPSGCEPSSSANTRRFSLFDVDSFVNRGHLTARVTYHKAMQHQPRILAWVGEYEATLKEMATTLPRWALDWTLADFPLAFKRYGDLDLFKAKWLVERGIKLADAEDVYPCSPVQQGILIVQAKDPRSYSTWFEINVRVGRKDSKPGVLDVSRLRTAWNAVVKRHGLLRALLVPQLPGSDGPMHVVLKNIELDTVLRTSKVTTANGWLQERRSVSQGNDQTAFAPRYCLSIHQPDPASACLRFEMNHVICDGFSLGLMEADLIWAYEDGGELPPGGSYSSFISYLAQQPRQAGIDFWSTYLTDTEPCIFPTSSGNCSSSECASATPVLVPRLDSKRLHAFCAEWDLTPATIIQTEWALVLGMYVGTDSPCFGNMSSGRDVPVPQVEDIFGPLLGMMPCRIRLDKSQSVLDTLLEVQNEGLDCALHQHTSLAAIHKGMGLDPSCPLFNTIMSSQKLASKAESVKEGQLTLEHGDHFDPTKYDVVVHMGDDSAQMKILLSFRPGCLSSADAVKLADRFSEAVFAIVSNPSVTLGGISLLGEEEAAQIWRWNSSALVPVERCVHHIVEDVVRAVPNAPAVHSWDGDLTYSEMSCNAETLSEALVAVGLRQGVMVPLCFEKSMWAPVAMLAVLKTGAAFVLLDSQLPVERLHTICRQVNTIDVILTSEKNVALGQKLARTVVQVSAATIADMGKEKKARNVKLERHLGKTRLAILPSAPSQSQPSSSAMFAVFTSGSTGTPKVAVLTYSNFASCLAYQAEKLGFHQESRVFDFASYAFDIAVHNPFAAFTTGGCLCISSDEDRKSVNIGKIMAE